MAITTCTNNVVDKGTGMGIGKLGSDSLIIKRKYRWLCEIVPCGGTGKTIPPYLVKLASRPDLTIEETELNFLNEKMWIPGKANFETITITFIDAVETGNGAADVNGLLLGWIASVYDFTDPCTRHQNTKRKDYVGEMTLTVFDGCGNPLEKWVITDAWPTSVKFGELDYTSSDTLDVEMTIRFSQLKYTALCGAAPVRCPCTGCGTGVGGGAIGGVASIL